MESDLDTTTKTPRVLFVDDGDIASMRGVERVIHPARKHQENPVLVADKPWESNIGLNGTVLAERGSYRMWYQAGGNNTYLNLYAESKDGISWTKPVLGQYEDFTGSLDNNIYLNRLALRSDNRMPLSVKTDHNQNVLLTPHMGKGRRYTMLSYDYGRSGYSAYDGYFLAFSDDGLHWTDGPEDPVIPGHADVGWFTFDQRDELFRGIVKTFLNIRGYHRRSVLWTESEDAFDWLMPRPAVIPDLEDEEWTQGHEGYFTQFYGMPIVRYESMLLGFLQIFKCTDAESSDGPMEVQLTSSRDGRSWQRVGDRRPILERGPEGAWDWGMVSSKNSLVSDGDEVRTYYSGTNRLHGGRRRALGDERIDRGVGLATWPRDRFVGLRSSTGGGELVVAQQRPLGELHVNANAAGGSLVAEVVEGGGPATGFEASNCIPMSSDSLDHVVRWRGDASLSSLEGRAADVRIKLENAEVFSLWWQ